MNIQIKGRIKLNKDGQFSQDVWSNTFNQDASFFILFVYYPIQRPSEIKIYFINSIVFAEKYKEVGNKKLKRSFSVNPSSQQDTKGGVYSKSVKELFEQINNFLLS